MLDIRPTWIAPNLGEGDGDELALPVSSTGLHVLFGANNSGKTRLLTALANGDLASDVTSDDLRRLDTSIQRFPGDRERDLWKLIPAIRLVWSRQSNVVHFHSSSAKALSEFVLPHLDSKQLPILEQMVANRLLPSVQKVRSSHLIKTNRFIPGRAPIDHSTEPVDVRLAAIGDWLDKPEAMCQCIADLAQSAQPHDRDRFESIRRRFSNIASVSLEVRRTGHFTNLHVIDGDSERSLDACGDGLRDLLGLLLHLECFRDTDLFIDDPGIRLHAAAQRRLLAVLEEEASRKAVWVASHDLVFVSARSAIARYAVTRTDGRTRVASVTAVNDVRTAIEELGWLPSDAFVADTLICCEGPSDRIVFESRITTQGSSKYSGIVVSDLGGVDKVWGRERKDLLRLARVARAVVAQGRVVAIIDRDKHSQHEVDTLRLQLSELGIGLHCLGQSELEDYWISSPPLVREILSGFAREAEAKSGATVRIPEIEDLENFLRASREGVRGSELLAILCQQYGLRFSKESAARIAVSALDSVAPDVAAAVNRDLDAAISAAR